MSISKKRAPRIDDPQLNRVVTQLYDDMNEIINAVNTFHLEEIASQGKIGDIRIVQLQENNVDQYYIEFRTKDGWARAEGTLISG